ncbi:interferon-induced very large GTPase 1-like isoform X2 [Lissotriton helveticus]
MKREELQGSRIHEEVQERQEEVKREELQGASGRVKENEEEIKNEGPVADGKVQGDVEEIEKEECARMFSVAALINFYLFLCYLWASVRHIFRPVAEAVVEEDLGGIKKKVCTEPVAEDTVEEDLGEIKKKLCTESVADVKMQEELRHIKNEEYSEAVVDQKALEDVEQIKKKECTEQELSSSQPKWNCPPIACDHSSCVPDKFHQNTEETSRTHTGPASPCLSDTNQQQETTSDRKKACEEILLLLKMDTYKAAGLSLRDVLEIGQESLNGTILESFEDVPWRVLRRIMALNMSARNTSFEKHMFNDEPVHVQNEGQSECNEMFCLDTCNSRQSINPLDVLCVLLNCSDTFLQQELMQKMSMCLFALPILLPPFEDSKCTFMLWAMRDIVRKWRPHSLRESKGFIEERLVCASMPTISFVRLKNCSLSKSKILNEVLSPPQQHHDFFIHRNMESGNVPRRISNGLVEISWYFPGGRESSDLFPEPVAFTNLRGDIESSWLQFSFLSEISSAVFIFVEQISEKEYALLLSLKSANTKYHFILNSQTDQSNTLQFLNKLAPEIKLSKSRLLVKDKTMNDAAFVKKLQSIILGTVTDLPCTVSIEDMAVTARELGIHVDEDCEECQSAYKCATEVTMEINDVVEYKKERMQLQGDLWKRLAKVEKEYCRMRQQGETPAEVYKSQLTTELSGLRRQQNECDLTNGMNKFISGVDQLSKFEKHFFLKWMKLILDDIARQNLSRLRTEYKELFSTLWDDPSQLAELDRKISDSSLGLEHFMRELGQFYEAEWSMIKSGKMTGEDRQFIHLPSIAADLLLEGFPLELIDGDASNIPMQWITDVLTELNIKLEGRSRIAVITVLGVQSTGKSTLLNTMFGLQFSVSSGRCTRGAFMLLIKVKDNLKEDLGCDFIVVIDTEGLKAPELAKLEDSYEHDNELATLVIGLSDITIVNIAMENATEMKDILQIVVHAFLRMETIGKIPNCQFVHQNVSDVSAYEKNMRDRKHLLEQLNEMTKAAAKMEKHGKEIIFSDIMEYDPEKHNWYVPGLWHGVPPMSPVNRGYSETVLELKRHLFDFIRTRSVTKGLKDIAEFKEWVKSLWNAVRHENFIFSFRNSLVADAYNQLSIKFSKWEWGFCKEMHLWLSKAEAVVYNQASSELDTNIHSELKQEAFQELQQGEETLITNVQKYFDSGVQNLHLIEKYREDFIMSAKSLKKQLERYLFTKIDEAIHMKKSKDKIEILLAKYVKEIELKVVVLLEDCRKRNCQLNEEELEKEFGNMWEQTISALQLNRVKRCQISKEIYRHLMQDLSRLGSFINQRLQNAQSLWNDGEISFCIKNEHFDLPWLCIRGLKERFTHECSRSTNDLAKALINRCLSYVDCKASSKVDYDVTYCRELLNMISDTLQSDDFRRLPTTIHFEVDLKLYILERASHTFQKMHEDFIEENDPRCCLEKFKPQYFSMFKDLYLRKDECQKRANDFCVQCLKPALDDYIEKRLGLEVVEDILHHGKSIHFGSRTFFQFALLEKLLEKKSFKTYKEYIGNYEEFVKGYIFKHVLDHYRPTESLQTLETNILSTITKKVKNVIQAVRGKQCKTIAQFLDEFCRILQNDLIISKNRMDVILFQNNASSDQFSDDIQFFLTELEQRVLKERKESDIEAKLSRLPLKPQDELFKKVFGCGKQCPFCKAPCEAGGKEHREHFASVHRPQGLGGARWDSTGKLLFSLCSTEVVSNATFRNVNTGFQPHPYKDYRAYFPDWCIQPDASIEASDYWKFVFKQFNKQFAEMYSAGPANLPSDWKRISKKQAKKSIQEAFNMKEQ